jgi:hypothetical protein
MQTQFARRVLKTTQRAALSTTAISWWFRRGFASSSIFLFCKRYEGSSEELDIIGWLPL